jgi:hypothetical protein
MCNKLRTLQVCVVPLLLGLTRHILFPVKLELYGMRDCSLAWTLAVY